MYINTQKMQSLHFSPKITISFRNVPVAVAVASIVVLHNSWIFILKEQRSIIYAQVKKLFQIMSSFWFL